VIIESVAVIIGSDQKKYHNTNKQNSKHLNVFQKKEKKEKPKTNYQNEVLNIPIHLHLHRIIHIILEEKERENTIMIKRNK